MGHIFISYSHDDKDYVHKLQDDLQREGFHVWIDDRIDYGEEWPMVIQEQLDACDALILVASKNSYKSKWVQKEVTRAQRIGKPFFPLLLSGTPWLSIESTQYADVTGGMMPPEKFYERLAGVTPRGGQRKQNQAPPEPDIKQIPAKGSMPVRSGLNAKIVGVISVSIIGIIILISISGIFKDRSAPEPTEKPANSPLPSATYPPPVTPTVAQTLTLAGPANEIIDGEAQMVLIPQGDFKMGSTIGDIDEKPVNTVFLDSYYIDKYKVTNTLYKLCVDSMVCAAPKFSNSYLRPSYYGDSRFDQYPVIGVDWYMAKTYCEWRGSRLPTEAEWEKAARGSDGRAYPWGEEIDQSRANYNNNGDPNYVGDTSGVDHYPDGISPYGLYDMAGNTWEWVADIYDSNYYNTLSIPVINPLGPTSGDFRVIRGGSWNSSAFNLRASRRSWNDPGNANVYIGFRCARSP